MREAVRSAFHEFSAPLEGKELTFMYLDSADPEGFVTTATGCLIDPVSMALGHPWQHPDGRAATQAEVVACWSLVKARQDLRKHGGMVYRGLSGNSLRLTPEAARNLVDKRLTWFDAALSKVFPDYESWPACAQLFALSWGWAVGVHAKYPRMIALLNAGDFAGASTECTINPQRGTIVTRNARNRMLLLNAARVQAYHLDPETLNWTSLIGVSDAETLPDLSTLADDDDTPREPVNAGSQPTIHPDPSAYLRPVEWLGGDEPPDDAA